jgi:aspartate kinase
VSYGEYDHYSCSFHEPYGYKTEWIDVRNFIKTDANYRDATVGGILPKRYFENVKRKMLNITQGFLGSDENNFTTTLGREGSDYTAAILRIV